MRVLDRLNGNFKDASYRKLASMPQDQTRLLIEASLGTQHEGVAKAGKDGIGRTWNMGFFEQM